MAFTLQTVKRTDGTADGPAGKVDINRGGMQGSMPHKCFYGEQVCSIFVQVCAKSVAEGMAGKPARPTEPVLMCMDMP